MQRPRLLAVLLIVAVIGFAVGKISANNESVRVSDDAKNIPLFPVPPKSDPASLVSGDIVMETPVEGAYIAGSVLEVSGRAKAEGGDLRIVIKDGAGTEIAASKAEIGAVTSGFGRFSKEFAFVVRPSGFATIEISRAAGDGVSASRRVTFDEALANSGELVAFQVFFHNSSMNPEDECDTVFPVERSVPAKNAGYRAAMEALLAGPTAEERALGYSTAIPSAARLKAVASDAQGVVTADFSEELDRGVAGSCRVGAIRTQIERTLRTFPEVRQVVIAVNGRIEDVLQP